ncbi:hypothetical protein [Streptomyces sp. NBC_00019]|jgi:hypothetical protein|uniref:hypothetical protein n=1 Tax=Streptomyces sp. NBC_00019 TaxID=2975623 RepID=UPI00324751F0
MDGQSDDDFMMAGRDLSSFTLNIMKAKDDTEVKGVIQTFETTEKYFSENFSDLTDDPPTSE